VKEGPHISNWSGPDFLAALPWDLFEYGIVESPSKTNLLRNPRPSQVRPQDFPAGVFFGRQAELKWRRRRNGRFHLVLIGEEGVDALPDAEVVSLCPVQAADCGLPQRIYLWGQPHGALTAAQWYEARIPRLIVEYPPEFSGHRVAVHLAHYTMNITVSVPLPGDAESRTIVVSRSTDLEKR